MFPSAAFQNLQGVVNLGEISPLLEKIVHHLTGQDQRLSALTREVADNYLPVQPFLEHMARIESRLTKIEDRLETVFHHCLAHLQGQDIPCSELTVSNYHTLQKINKILTTCISRQEVEVQYQNLLSIREKNVEIERNLEKVSVLANEQNNAQLAMNSRLGNLDAMVATKLDRSELVHLQALTAKVSLYDDFRKNTIDRLEKLSTHDKVIDQHLDDYKTRIDRLSQGLQVVDEVVPKLASKKDLHALARLVTTHSHEIAACASLTTQNEALLSTKASLIITDGLQDRAHIIEEAILTESKRTDIAIRFVEWFTSRGEHYEHNLQILDKHLKDLVVSEKSPRVHTFFLPGNRMEFTPYKGPQPPSHLQTEK
eukprot:gene8134-8974_t